TWCKPRATSRVDVTALYPRAAGRRRTTAGDGKGDGSDRGRWDQPFDRGAGGGAMRFGGFAVKSVRDLPQLRTRHDDDHEILPGDACSVGRPLDQGLPVAPD